MPIPIPIRFRWSQHHKRLTAESDPIHVLVDRVEHLEIKGLPQGLTELDYWAAPTGCGLLREACGRETEMTAEQQLACRSHFDVLMARVAAAVQAFFTMDDDRS